MGIYRQLADAVEALLSPMQSIANILDLGCGEGYYSVALQRAQPQAQLYGVDIAKPAVRMASKQYSQARFAVASAFQLPLLDASQDVVLRVFAPSDDRELRRVLAAQGGVPGSNTGTSAFMGIAVKNCTIGLERTP